MIFPQEFREGFTVHAVSNARYANDLGTSISADVDWGGGPILYAISPADPEPWGAALFEHCVQGEVLPYEGPSTAELQEQYEVLLAREALQKEFDELMIDIQLGMATPEELERAKEIRTQLKG